MQNASNAELAEAAYVLAEEIRDGKWNHLREIRFKPASAIPALIRELRNRVPGFTDAEYAKAIGDGLFASR